MIQRALLRTFFRELIRRARSDTVQAAEKCSRQSVRLVAQIKQPMRAQNRKRAPASPLIIWPAIPHGLGYLPTPGWRANPSPCLHSSLCERQICHCFWQNHSRLLLQRQGLQKCYRSKGPPSALLTVQMAYSLQRGAQGYFQYPQRDMLRPRLVAQLRQFIHRNATVFSQHHSLRLCKNRAHLGYNRLLVCFTQRHSSISKLTYNNSPQRPG